MPEPLSPKQLGELHWREKITFAQRRAIEMAGLMTLRVWGEQIAHFEPIDSLDGEPIPQTMDEAFVLLRRLADRTDLSPLGVLLAFVAGDLAGSVAAEAFPSVLLHRVEGKGVRPPADEPRRGGSPDEVFDLLKSERCRVLCLSEELSSPPCSKHLPIRPEHCAPEPSRKTDPDVRKLFRWLFPGSGGKR